MTLGGVLAVMNPPRHRPLLSILLDGISPELREQAVRSFPLMVPPEVPIVLHLDR